MRDGIFAHQMCQSFADSREHVTSSRALLAAKCGRRPASRRFGGVSDRALKSREEEAGGQQSEPVDIPADFGDLAPGAVGPHPKTLARVLKCQSHFLDGFVQPQPGFGVGQLLLKG